MLGLLMAAANAAQPSGSTIDTLLAPAGGLAAALGLALMVSREYRAARRENVAAARKRAEEAEKEAKEARDERDADIAELRTLVEQLQDKVEELNRTIR